MKIVMMQKDENLLLDLWARYHAAIVGAGNIHILDNGSAHPQVLDTLRALEADGFVVDRSKNTREHFTLKGKVIAKAIKRFDLPDPPDFAIPLDCDEFLAARGPAGALEFAPAAILAALEPHRGATAPLMIEAGFENLPDRPDHYVRKVRRKTFFAGGTCRALDLGFHRGVTASGEEGVVTGLLQMHLHNKPLADLQRHARDKMRERVADFSEETLRRHAEDRGKGVHLVPELMFKDEAEYFGYIAQRYARQTIVAVPQFRDRLRELGRDLPY